MSEHSCIIAGLEFHPREHGWTAMVPLECGAFQGHAVLILIGTRVLAYRPKKLPYPSGEQINLVTYLLSNLGEAFFICATHLARYCTDPSFIGNMAPPEMWIPPEEESDGPMAWTMVLEHRADEEDGYHIECDGIKFIHIFSYDDTKRDLA